MSKVTLEQVRDGLRALALDGLRAMKDPTGVAFRKWADAIDAELQRRAKPETHLQATAPPALYQHDDGRYALALGDVARHKLTDNDPGWHRVPLDVVAAGEDPPGLGALSQDYLDACRFRLLTDDHGDREVRDQVRRIIERLPVMSYAAACRDLDEVFRNKAKATGAQEGSR